jgi:hypothetical protein
LSITRRRIIYLNDLRPAAGGEQKHQPRYWLDTQQTKDLIAELIDDGIPSSEQNRPVNVTRSLRLGLKGLHSESPQKPPYPFAALRGINFIFKSFNPHGIG